MSQREEITQTVVIYTLGEEIDSKRALQYDKSNDDFARPIVRISQDFEEVVLANYGQNYILSREDAGTGYSQKSLYWLRNKIVQ